jgi:hypothetical protein
MTCCRKKEILAQLKVGEEYKKEGFKMQFEELKELMASCLATLTFRAQVASGL